MGDSADNVAIGSIVWSTAVDGDGHAAFGGIVVDVGVWDGGEEYVEILDPGACDFLIESRKRGSRHPKSHRTVGLRRLALSDLNVEATEPPSPNKMEAFASAALVSTAVTLPYTSAWELVIAAGKLYEVRAAIYAAGRERPLPEYDHEHAMGRA